MNSDAIKTFTVTQWRAGQVETCGDTLIVEAALEIRLGKERFTVTMRTPGHNLELTRGLLLTEGLIQSESDIGPIRHCDTGEAADSALSNIVTVRLQNVV